MKPIALITGATSGIGRATAKILAANNFKVIITGRRLNRLSEIEEEIIKHSDAEVYALNFDIRSKEETEKAFNEMPDEWKAIDILINNAGLASGFEPIYEGDTDNWEQMIDTNIKGLLYITRIVSQGMIERRKGHIVNISSIAGKEAYANGAVYCATKHAVDALSKSMRLDLLKHNIKVSNIAPGMVDTEFSLVRFHGDSEKATNVYKDMTPLYAEDVAEAILFIVTRQEHVNIDDMLIMPTAQGLTRDVARNNK